MKVSLKVQILLIIRDPDEKGKHFKVVIFAIKTWFPCRIWRGVQWCYFRLSVLHTLVKTQIWKFYLRIFSKFLNDIKATFKPIDLKFGIYIVHTCMTRIFNVFFENFLFWKLYNVFFSTFDFLKSSSSKTLNFEILRWQLCTTQHSASFDVLQPKIAW